jgi:RimJ/RimL family protein N-acetyltransferase
MNFLQGKAVSIVPLGPETDAHVDAFLQAHNDPEMRTTGPYHGPFTPGRARDYIAEMQDRDMALVCAIDAGGDTAGVVGTYMSDERARATGLYYFVLPEHQGKGYATEAARLLTGFAFDDLNARKVAATVVDGNSASERVLEKLSFQQEGQRRDQMYKDGQYRDVTEWGVLEDEFE